MILNKLFEAKAPIYKKAPIHMKYVGKPIKGTLPATKVVTGSTVSYDRSPTELKPGDTGYVVVKVNTMVLDKPSVYFERDGDRGWFRLADLKYVRKI